jgi:hypothetical protein
MKEVVENGIVFIVSDNYPEPPYTKVLKAVAAKNKILSRYEFRSLFTFQEIQAITTAAKTDVAIEVFMESMRVAEEINLDYPETSQGLAYLVSLGLITQEKMDNILAGF